MCQEILFRGLDKKLLDSECTSCEGPEISMVELASSLKTMSTDKAPGPDGFTVEFFVKFWDLLGPLLSDVIYKCFLDGSVCDSMKSSLTRLIFKKRGDIKDLKNWCPISLLNVNYKIFLKAITLRLSKVPGNSISGNIIMIMLRNVLDNIHQTDETGILVSLH